MVLNATSVGEGRRNRAFLCMCSRNCNYYYQHCNRCCGVDASKWPSDGKFFWLLLLCGGILCAQGLSRNNLHDINHWR